MKDGSSVVVKGINEADEISFQSGEKKSPIESKTFAEFNKIFLATL